MIIKKLFRNFLFLSIILINLKSNAQDRRQIFIGFNGSINYKNELKNYFELFPYNQPGLKFSIQQIDLLAGIEYSNGFSLAGNLGLINLMDKSDFIGKTEKHKLLNFGVEPKYRIRLNEKTAISFSSPLNFSKSFDSDKYQEINGSRFDYSNIEYSIFRANFNAGISYLITNNIDIGIDFSLISYSMKWKSYLFEPSALIEKSVEKKLGFIGNHDQIVLPFRLKLNYYFN